MCKIPLTKLRKPLYIVIVCLMLNVSIGHTPTFAQDEIPTPIPEDMPPEAPDRVEVQPTVRDEAIASRLQTILSTTGWFTDAAVTVQDGVVFLRGDTETDEFKRWAGDLARNTQDVTAVVNQIEVVDPPILDFQPLLNGLREQTRAFLRAIPVIFFGFVVLFIAFLIARVATRRSRHYLEIQNINTLLRNVISRSIGVLIFLGGLYLVFQIAGLTNIALTILGGTGLLGLILGIAFRDITENFLASIFLSIQNPFSIGDLVEINDIVGYIQRMTTRTTILMTLAGNHVQIPNATVYKSIIHNFSSNPNRQIDFTIGIGYDDSISLAQEVIRQVLEDHPAVLNDPEHLVLVDGLGSATVNLQIYFWLNGAENSWVKVKSSVIRLVKRAIQDAGISMPDEAREMIFPQGVPVHMIEQAEAGRVAAASQRPQNVIELDTVSTSAEGGLKSEAEEIKNQAEQSRTPEPGENLLE